ncbi:HupE/UreJ family protein [Reichenbachiella carrageenanivorans]|uniref:HupE/UreJ family protein n=1 Tax=Reichenbachiella carrageenanivorans TaxID=2979869 RepID=A0ABY6D5R7_9BACT|nr:HupE/UreJ family protein [Reichenbachiella carrageenanivorans]UXX80940.1 HupE/UreJ family protein [Reichenbachiella carrageenanivorans]
MSDFQLYFSLGREHILDVNGYDHILFVIALSAVYLATDWKKVLVLVTAFTIGHSVTLAMVALDVFRVNSSVVEFLIPVTIFITAVCNIWKRDQYISTDRSRLNYYFALFFGLIHGMGFSNYLKALLGKETSIVTQLFAFNIGLEVGQVIIVVGFMGLGYLMNKYINVSRRDWILAISSAVAGVAITLMIDTKFW